MVQNLAPTILLIAPPISGRRRGFDVRVVCRTSDLAGLSELWERLNWNPNASEEFFRLINDVRPNVLQPYLLLLERAGAPSALVIGRIVTQDFFCRLGYKTIRLGRVRELSIIYGGVLGPSGEEEAAAVVEELMSMLQRREADLVLLSHLNTKSSLFSRAVSAPGFLCRDHLVSPQAHWKTQLPGSQSDFLQRLNKKHRYWLRRLEKLVDQDFPGQVVYRNLAGVQDLSRLMVDLESVAAKTYQRRLGAGFRNDPEHARRMAFEAGKGWLRAYVLSIQDRPCAFWVGTLYKRTFYSAFTGYDPDYRKYELGTLIFMKMVGDLCAEKAEFIDYGLGDALYKERFGDQRWEEASVYMFAPSLRGFLLNAARTSIETPALWLRWVLKRTTLQQKLKTLWRRRLVKKENR